MATNLTVNNVTFSYPQTGDVSWGDAATNWASAVTTGMLQKAGGAFTLTAETDFGPNYGLKSLYYKSRATNPADAGQLRLGNTETVSWRNAGNSANLDLAASASDRLAFGGVNVPTISSTDTLTNKTMSGASNTFSSIGYSSLSLAGSIVNADISTSAAIARSKVASGSNNHVVINDGSGNLSSEANLAITRGGTGQATASAAFDALAPTTTKGDIIVRNSSTNTNQPIGTDGQVLVADSSQAVGLKWTTLNQGAKNYITYNNFENNATTGWSLSHTTLSSNVPNQASGSWTAASGSLAISTVSSGKLAGSYSLQMAWTGTTSVAGDMLVSQAYTIDAEDQAKCLTGKFYFSPTAGASLLNFSGSVNNTYQIYIYDVANSAWIQPAGVYGMTQSSGVGYCTFTFQTPSNMTQFRLAIVCINASSSGSHTILFDDFSVGPQTAPTGPAVSDEVTATMTIGAVTTAPTKGTVVVDKLTWRRVGDCMELQYQYKQSAAGAAGSGQYLFPIPGGYSIDTSKIDTTQTGDAAEQGVGNASLYDGTTNYTGSVVVYNTTNLSIGGLANATAYNLMGSTFVALSNTTVRISFTARVPIAGWSSNVQMSSDTDTRVVAFSAYKNASQTFSTNNSAQKVTIDTITKDSHGAFDTATNNRYIAPVSGWYVFSGNVNLNNTNILNARYSLQLFVNGSQVDEELNRVLATSVGDRLTATFKPVYMNAGDYAELDVFGAGNNSASTYTSVGGVLQTWFAGYRLSGPSAIAATETVAARYTNSAGTTLTKSAANTVPFATKDYDTHGAWNGTDTFTCPVSGKFAVKVTLTIASGATWAAGDIVELDIMKNGANHTNSFLIIMGSVTGAINVVAVGTLNCIAGDTIKLNCTPTKASAGNVTLNTTAAYNSIAIERVGN